MIPDDVIEELRAWNTHPAAAALVEFVLTERDLFVKEHEANGSLARIFSMSAQADVEANRAAWQAVEDFGKVAVPAPPLDDEDGGRRGD
jgi:hypothetical protein